MLVTFNFICYFMRCPIKEATTEYFSFKNLSFKPPSDNRILVVLLMMDLSCCFPAVFKAFRIYTDVFEGRFNQKICYYTVNC